MKIGSSKNLFLILTGLSLASCVTIKNSYKITSAPEAARIEVDGSERCTSTPCEIEIRCNIGAYGPGAPRFMAAFPISKNANLSPQAVDIDCLLRDVETTINFDLSKPKVGDFTPGSHVQNTLRSYLSFGRTNYSAFLSQGRKYYPSGYELALGKDLFFNDAIKIWGTVNFFSANDPPTDFNGAAVPSIVGSSALLQIYPKALEHIFLASGPLYFHQYHGEELDVFAVYVGGGAIFGIPYPGGKKFSIGDNPLGMSLESGYVFPFSHLERAYSKTTFSLRLFF